MPDNNSFVRKPEDKQQEFEERKKDLVQFDNVKQVRKKKDGQVVEWFRTMFLSGRTIKEILKDIAEHQLVPQIKDNFRNGIVSFIDLWIYKDHSTTISSSTPSGSFVTNYVQFSNTNTTQAQKEALEKNKQEEQKLISSGYETPAFRDYNEAKRFLQSMHEYCNKWDTMSVHSLAWMQKKVINYTWDRYGWPSEVILAIKEPTHINNPDAPWAIILPKAQVLN